MGEDRLPQMDAKRPMTDPHNHGARTALPRRSARMPGKPQIHPSKSDEARSSPFSPTHRPGKGEPRPLGFKLPAQAKSIDRFN